MVTAPWQLEKDGQTGPSSRPGTTITQDGGERQHRINQRLVSTAACDGSRRRAETWLHGEGLCVGGGECACPGWTAPTDSACATLKPSPTVRGRLEVSHSAHAWNPNQQREWEVVEAPLFCARVEAKPPAPRLRDRLIDACVEAKPLARMRSGPVRRMRRSGASVVAVESLVEAVFAAARRTLPLPPGLWLVACGGSPSSLSPSQPGAGRVMGAAQLQQRKFAGERAA